MMPGNHGYRQRSRNHGGNRGGNHGGNPNHGGNQHARERISAIHAPYNFAPLHREIFTPGWADEVSHDRPFRDGLCGSLQLSITTHTPILVGNARTGGGDNRPGEVHFHKAPDGRYMIPGSALRGMIRNVLEIAAFGRMRFVDDRAMGLRDLGGGLKDVYRNAIRPEHVRAGWMRFRDGGWEITPCDFVRVHHNQLKAFAESEGVRNLWMGGREPRIGRRYGKWKNLPRRLGFSIGKTEAGIKKARDLARTGEYVGELVLTGQPGGNKKHDFIFHDPREGERFKLDEASVTDFKQVYGDSKNQDNPWNYWQPKFRHGEAVPVFFVEYRGRIAVGLSSMFRLPYRHSIHDAVRHTSADHLANRGDDLPALIFGFTDEDQGHDSLKGRAWFTPAFAMGQPQVRAQEATILNGPKPSYYPNYIDQPQSEPGRLAGGQYKTLMDDNCEIRGFKRYPARRQAHVQLLRGKQAENTRVQTKLYPLDAGVRFDCRLAFHNLKPEELGALIWALTWGGNDALRHSIGMGKPFGFGQVSIRIDGADIRPNDPAAGALTTDECMARFVALMKAWKPNWEATPQLRNLLAMADPSREATAPGGRLTHMRLTGAKDNDFVDAKNARLVLAAYAGDAAGGAKGPGPRNPGPQTQPRKAGQTSPAASAPRGRVDIEAVKRKAAERSADAEAGDVLPLDHRVEVEQAGTIVEVRDSSVIVRLEDGTRLERRREVQGVKQAEIREGLRVFAYGKGLSGKPHVGAGKTAPSKPVRQKLGKEDMRKTLGSKFKVRDR